MREACPSRSATGQHQRSRRLDPLRRLSHADFFIVGGRPGIAEVVAAEAAVIDVPRQRLPVRMRQHLAQVVAQKRTIRPSTTFGGIVSRRPNRYIAPWGMDPD
jgi:hypothetical protein